MNLTVRYFCFKQSVEEIERVKIKAKITFHSYLVFTMFGILNSFLYIWICIWHHFPSFWWTFICMCYSVHLLTMDYISFAYFKRSTFCPQFWWMFLLAVVFWEERFCFHFSTLPAYLRDCIVSQEKLIIIFRVVCLRIT